MHFLGQQTQIVDASGEYLIPGLWDMHTHIYFDSTAADGTDLILPLFLANGITGVRCAALGAATGAAAATTSGVAAPGRAGARW